MGKKNSTSTSSVTVPPEVLARYNAVNARAETAGAAPFQGYGTQASDFVAQMNAQQGAGIADINTKSGSYQPYIDTATTATTAGMGPAYAGIQNYMSPYIQNVADTTGAMLRQANEQAQSGALGTAVSSGAFGGDRAGIAAANLANQQGMAYGKTMADIYNQGYTQALGASQADLARQLAGGSQMAGLGAQSQQLGLQGAQAKIAAGTMQQQTEQAGKDALINQFMQEKGYPFQVAQFLANVAMGTGTASGSTTTTVQPASYFSDRRLKEDVERIGEGDNGLPIYKYRYKGEPETHIGFMADEVEKVRPDAVGTHSTGYKTVDYDRATKAEGGGVAGPYGAITSPQPGLGSYIPEGYLPQYELMIADPSHLENARQSFAQQLEAAANLGNSVKDIEGNWQYWSDKWGSDPKKEAVAQGARSSGAATGLASGGSAYMRPISADMGARGYLSDVLDAQSNQDNKSSGLQPPAQPPQARTTGQDLADIAKVAMAIFGMNRGGRTGYATRGGVDDEVTYDAMGNPIPATAAPMVAPTSISAQPRTGPSVDMRRLRGMTPGAATNLLPSGTVPGPDRISRPVTYYPQGPNWREVTTTSGTEPRTYQYDTNFGMVRDAATGQLISNERSISRNDRDGIDRYNGNARETAIRDIENQLRLDRTAAQGEVDRRLERYKEIQGTNTGSYAQSSQDPKTQFPEEYQAYQDALRRLDSANATVMPSSVTGRFGNQANIMMREAEPQRPMPDRMTPAFRQRALANEPPLSMYKEYVSPDDAPFFDPNIPETRPEPTGLGLRLLGNEPPASMARMSPDDAYIPTPRWALPVEPTSLSYGLAPASVDGSGTPLSYSPPADRGPAPLSYGLAPAGVGGSGTPLSYSPTGVAPAAPLSSSDASTTPAPAATGVVAPTAADTAAPQVTADGLTVVPVSDTTITGLQPGQTAEPMGWNTLGPKIKARESGGDYDALYGFSHRDGGKFAGVKVTDMTIDQALEFADPSGEYGQWVARTRPDKEYGVATPLGAFQIVGSTLRGIKEGMGLTGNEKMTPALQEEMAKWLYQQEGAKPWRNSEGKVQTTGGLMPAGGEEEEQFRAANRMEAPGGLKPYKDRNVLGQMMYDPETNKLSRNALLSLASGIGATLSSPSQFLLPSLGLGLQSAAGTYAGLEKQAADIAQTQAETRVQNVAADKGRIYEAQNGVLLINFGDGRPPVELWDFLDNPEAYSTGDPQLDAQILRDAQSRAAGEEPQTGVFSSPQVQTLLDREVTNAQRNPNDAANQSAAIEVATNASAAVARSSIPSILTQADAVAALTSPDAKVRAGALGPLKQTVTNYLNDLAQTVTQVTGVALPTIKDPNGGDAVANAQLILKEAVASGMLNASGIQELQTIMSASPNVALSAEANSALMAGLLVSGRTDMRRADFMRDYKAQPDNRFRTVIDAGQAFQDQYGNQILAEKAVLKELIHYGNQPMPPEWVAALGEYKTPMEFLMTPGISPEDKSAFIEKLLPSMGVNPLVISALNGPDGMYIGNYFGG
jgi:hypothetical protein